MARKVFIDAFEALYQILVSGIKRKRRVRSFVLKNSKLDLEFDLAGVSTWTRFYFRFQLRTVLTHRAVIHTKNLIAVS